MAESIDNNHEGIIKEAVQQFIDAQLRGEKPEPVGTTPIARPCPWFVGLLWFQRALVHPATPQTMRTL